MCRIGRTGCGISAFLLFWAGAAPSVHAQADGEDAPAVLNDMIPVALDPHMVFENVVVGSGGVELQGEAGEVAGDEGRLIYSNTLGIHAVNFPTNQPVSDDIATTAPDGCNLRTFKFKVLGKVLPTGASGPYTVKYALYTNCPLAIGSTAALRDLVKIPGTDGEVSFLDDGPRAIKHIVDSHNPVAIPTNVYLGLQFNRSNCGTVVGAPAMVGFSGDQFDAPGFPCNSYLGGFPALPHASFWLEMYGDTSCPASYPGYMCARASGLVATFGANIQGADDVKLIVNDCNMVGYEVVVKGVGYYTFDLRQQCDGAIIPGTQRNFIVNEATQPKLQIARFTFDPPIHLTTDSLFLGFKSSANSSGAVIAGIEPIIGESTSEYFIIGPEGCAPFMPPSFHGAVNLAITCSGETPVGACCDMALLECQGGQDAGKRCLSNADCVGGTCEAVCREVRQVNCPWPPKTDPPLGPAWVEGGTCQSPPFPHTCGLSACCKPDDTCENLTKNECAAVLPLDGARLWQGGEFCSEGDQWCPFSACLAREGNCSLAHEGVGCSDPFCCQDVCTLDPWCCHVEWDTVCVGEAQTLCNHRTQNDECARSGGFQATEVVANSSAAVSNANATQNPNDPAFTCHRDESGIQGFHTTWFVFEAVDASARIYTCNAYPPAQDTLVAIYLASDPSTPQTACASLSEIACSDDAVGCGTDVGSDVCVTGLVPGQRYYIQVATHSEEGRGIVELDIESPCPAAVATLVEAPPTASLAAALQQPAVSAVEGAASAKANGHGAPDRQDALHGEVLRDPWMPRPDNPPPGVVAHAGPWIRDGHVSIQVNVDASGNNIVGDAANEPSIAIDPTNPNRIVIGFRQFDTIQSDFRQGGWGYSQDGGQTWTFPGVLEPGVFRTDPVLDADANGNIFYYSLRIDNDLGYVCDMYRSFDGGMTWNPPIYAFGGDKAWMTIDRTTGPGRGNIYAYWSLYAGCCSDGHFTRSTDGGLTYDQPILIPGDPGWGTLAVAPDGSLYVSGVGGLVAKSTNTENLATETQFDWSKIVDLGGYDGIYGAAPNPDGLLGQAWVATPKPGGPNPNHVYLLATVHPTSGGDPADIMFARSTDGGSTWEEPVRVNDDPRGNGAWQWFGTMSVAPTTGRIDVVWNDTRSTGAANLSELYYAYSFDDGVTWSANTPVSPVFNSHIGWPRQEKLGDYYHTASDATGVNIAYAATFNGEQDVYFLRIDPFIDCNHNGLYDPTEVTGGATPDCNANIVPDECERDFDHDGQIDECDEDIDNDGVSNGADVCDRTVVGTPVQPDGRPKSDTNENCLIDLNDYWRFRNCMVNGRLGFPAPEHACRESFDHDSDGNINLRDFAGFQNAFGGSSP